MTRVKGQYRGLMASGCAAARREGMAIWIAPISRGDEHKSEECRL
jgi:hypothetical protein